MGELHLEVLVDRMQREFAVEATVGKPQVAYRETITKQVESVEYRHIKQTGGSGQFAVVKITLEPNPGKGYEFDDKISGGAHPARVHPARQPGHPVGARLGRARRLPDGRRQGDASSTASTTTSTPRRWRSRSPARWPSARPPSMAKPVLLEPIMSVEVVTPEEYMGDVMGDLSSRRGRIGGMEARGNTQVVTGPRCRCRRCSGTVPTSVRAPRAGRPTRCSSTAYQQVPEAIATEIIKRVRGE